MNNKDRKKINLPSGFNDFLPEEESWRSRMLSIVKSKFELFGFVPIDTPAIEEEKILTSGDANFQKEIFRIQRGGSNKNLSKKETLALRFDLTVPLARFVLMYGSKIGFPFKRYQIGKVWRGEKAQSGRYREFLQCDADIIGSSSVLADAEIIFLIYEIMSALGFKKFTIRVNSREILNALPAYIGFPPRKLDEVLRIIDKTDKIGIGGVKKELAGKKIINNKKIEKLIKLFSIKSANNKRLINILKQEIYNDFSKVGFKKLEELSGYLDNLGMSDKSWEFDLKTVRGLSYYTGFVFETFLNDFLEIGSVFSGGRYDNLVSKLGGSKLSAVGASLGFDRMFYALKSLQIIPQNTIYNKTKIIVLYPESKNSSDAFRVALSLRKNNIPVDIYLDGENPLKSQMSYALKNNYKIAIIVGSQEIKENEVIVKVFDMYKQFKLKMENLAEEVGKFIE